MNEWKTLLKKVISDQETSLNSLPMFFRKIHLPFSIFICGKHEKTAIPKTDNYVLSS